MFTRFDGEIRFAIIQSLEGIFGFPKGHMEHTETEEETALREIREEIGVSVTLIPGFRAVEEHPLPNKPNVMKQIVYFLAEYQGQALRHQREELLGVSLMDYESAMAAFQFDNNRRVLREAQAFLQKL